MTPKTLRRKLQKKSKRKRWSACKLCKYRPVALRTNGDRCTRRCGKCGWIEDLFLSS